MLPHTSPRSHDGGDLGAQGGRGTGLGECFLGAPCSIMEEEAGNVVVAF